MKFNLTTVKYRYEPKEIPDLEKLGFEFRADGTMEKDEVSIEFSTLEELAEFSKKWGALIIDGEDITIYDDYIE